jgi:AGCS family alanine or glycine:cation symporter
MENGSGNLIFGIVTAILVAIVIIGGIKRIATVAEAIVPLMAGVYILAGLIIIGVNISSLPSAVSLIFEKAFSPDAAVGGFIGAMIAGFQRAAFSNEAGVGSAAIAHSAVRTTHAASEGVVALLEPFIDTVIICTMSALVIIVTGNYNAVGADGVAITSKAFSSVLPGFEYVLTFAVVLFALSTMLSWSYYGLQAWKFLFGKSKLMDISYKIIFCIFIIIGSTAGLGSVVGFSDAMIFAMVFPNIIGVIFLAPVITKEVNKFVGDIKSGRIKAVK